MNSVSMAKQAVEELPQADPDAGVELRVNEQAGRKHQKAGLEFSHGRNWGPMKEAGRVPGFCS